MRYWLNVAQGMCFHEEYYNDEYIDPKQQFSYNYEHVVINP